MIYFGKKALILLNNYKKECELIEMHMIGIRFLWCGTTDL